MSPTYELNKYIQLKYPCGFGRVPANIIHARTTVSVFPAREWELSLCVVVRSVLPDQSASTVI